MSASLAEKIRIARHGSVEVKGITFNYSRPTDIQMSNLYQEFQGEYQKPEIAKRFVFGWSGVKESDLIPEGSDKDVKFDSDTFEEWLNDARDYWAPLCEAILGAYVDYSTEREDAVKN